MARELPPPISYVKNPITWDHSSTGDSFSIYGLDRIQSVSRGTGLVYFWIERGGVGSRGNQFVCREGFNETLCEIREPGPIMAEWKPVNRAFQECLLAFHPPNLNTLSMTSMLPSFDDLAQHLGAPEDDYSGTQGDYVIGDGVGISHTIRLVIDRGQARHPSDTVRLRIT